MHEATTRRSSIAMVLGVLLLTPLLVGLGPVRSHAQSDAAGPPDATWVWTSSQIHETGYQCTAQVHGQNATDTAQLFEARATFEDSSTDQRVTTEVPARQMRTAELELTRDREHMLTVRALTSRWAFTGEVICYDIAEAPTPTEPDDPSVTSSPVPTTPELEEVSRYQIKPGDWQLTGPIYSVAEGIQGLQGSIGTLSNRVGNHTRNICVDGSVRNVDGDRNQLHVHLLSPTTQTVQLTFHTNHGSWSKNQDVTADAKTTVDVAALLLHPTDGPYPNAKDVETSVEVTSDQEVFVECAQYFKRSVGGVGGIAGMEITPAIAN